MKSQWLFAFFVITFSLATSPIFAQGLGGGTTGGTGGFGSTGGTTGGTTSGSTTQGSGTTSGSATGSSSSTMSGFTQLQNNGVGASSATVRAQNANGLGATSGASGGSSFGGGGGGGGMGGLGMGGMGFGGLGQGFGGSSSSTKPALRTRLRSSVTVAPLQAREIQYSAQSRFYETPVAAQFNGVQVNMSGGNAVISGVVRSEKDRRMSELLMRLEPGVRRVTNQVIVAP